MKIRELGEINAVIFDMDGLLVDSEPLWHIAEKETFATVGLFLSTDDCLKTTGMPTKYVMQYWFDLQPWQGKTVDELEADLYVSITRLIKSNAVAMPGVIKTLDYFKSKNIKMGVASASPLFLIDIVLEKLGITAYFEFVHSALLEKNNKPHPDVYITVASKLNVSIENCLIFEDSINGVKGAVASGAKVIAVPEPHFYDFTEYEMANNKIRSLNEFHEKFLKEF